MNHVFYFSLVLFLNLLLGIAHSSTTDVNFSETRNNSLSKFLKKITPDSISSFSIFNGPNLAGDLKPNDFEGNLNNDDGINSWHQISFRYQLTPKTKLILNPRFEIFYNGTVDGTQNQFDTRLDSPVFGIDTVWYENGNFSINGGIDSVLFVRDEVDKERGLQYNPGGFQSFDYKLNNNSTTGLWVWARYRKYTNSSADTFPMFVSPYYSYQQNDKIGYTAFYQINGAIEDDAKKIRWDEDDHFNVQVSYAVSKNIILMPMITVFRETNFELSKGNLNMWLVGKFY